MIPVSSNLRSRLAVADEIVVFTGAGMSAESGVPTFRGEDGIWKKFKPEELANFDAFIENPKLVWEWYRHRKRLISEISPHAGHFAIAAMERVFGRVTVITQNIDNLHRRAGSTRIHELHGNIERNYCIGCGKDYPDELLVSATGAPHCAKCNGLIRPDVVWFGELLPTDEWDASVAAAGRANLFFAVGTSAVVYPAASLPRIAKGAGAFVVEINIERTGLSSQADEFIMGKAGDVLPVLGEIAAGQRKNQS
jgi:NAD-dependent deacetylase